MKFTTYLVTLVLLNASLSLGMNQCSAQWLSNEVGQTAEEIMQQITDFAHAKKDAPSFWLKITSEESDSFKYQVLVTKHNLYAPLNIQIASTNSALIDTVLNNVSHGHGFHFIIEESVEVEFVH